MTSTPTSDAIAAGTLLDQRYTIHRVIGIGGFGITYEASNILTGQRVAIKEWKAGDKEGFLREARMLHDFAGEEAVVSVLDYFEENNTAFLVMEYLDGVTLREYVEQKGKMTAEEAVRLFAPVFEALERIHAAGIIHRDISPDNLMVLEQAPEEADDNNRGVRREPDEAGAAGANHRAPQNDPDAPDATRKTRQICLKLMDFGAAKSYEGANVTHSVIYKPSYSPPEQMDPEGVMGSYTDVYALCGTIYYCITGSRPVESIQRSYEHDPLRKPSELGAVIPAHDERVLMKALSIKPEDRYPSVRDFRAALLDSYEPPEPTRAPSGSTKTPVKPGGKPPGMSPVLVLVLVVIGVLAGILAAAGISAVLQGRQESTGTAELTADTVEDADAPLLEADEVTEETQAASEETVSTAGTVSSAGTASQAQAASKENTPIPTVEPTPTAEPEETTPIPTVEPTAATDTGTKAGGNDGPRIITLEEAGLSDHEINWKDPVLEERMREKTGIKDRPVRLSDVWETQEFMINGKADSGGDGGITDISALGELRNLQRLNLNYNAIQDISPLANLENLTWLTINTNKITDLTPLKELQYLETLDASNNQIGDFSAFETMPSLARISVYGTGLNDEGLRKLLGHLEPKERVKKLDIGGNNITDYSGFAELVNIEKLAMWDSQVDDMKLKELVSVIKNLLNLTQLTLRNNEISDLTPLMELPRIEVLNLYQNLIMDITPLGSLKHLKELRLGGNHISDLSPVDKSIIKDIDQVL